MTCLTPQLVKIDGNHFLLMWKEKDRSSSGSVCRLLMVDAQGEPVTEIFDRKLQLSSCQPVLLSDGTAGWYVTDGSCAKLYRIDPFNLEGIEFEVAGKASPMKVTVKDAEVKYSKVKKAKQVVSVAITVKKAKGSVSYTKVKNGSAPELSVNKTTGKITVKKGTKKGKYKIIVKVRDSGSGAYRGKTKKVTVTIKVK